jgi:2-dehydro-3-deoxyphosphogluconate aldolase/(4S)-4-hydroxy-2-oxoglutarate aldolase
MDQVLEQIRFAGILPVVVIENEDAAGALAGALLGAGLGVSEVTFRTAAAAKAIGRIAREQPSMLVGAGTVLSVDQVKTAVDAGAKFIVSPGLQESVVGYCLDRKVPVVPGIATPTEAARALEMGLGVVKFFPAEQCGGLGYLKAIAAPFPDLRFIPTGGIDETNLEAYLAYPKVLACGGSWMVKQDLIGAGRFADIGALASRAVSLVLGLELLYFDDARGAGGLASALAKIVNFPVKAALETAVGDGRFAVRTSSVDRAMSFLARKGVKSIAPASGAQAGNSRSIFLDTDAGRVSLQIIQR